VRLTAARIETIGRLLKAEARALSVRLGCRPAAARA
jgi:hypothetical protein